MIKPESAPTLAEMAKFLKANATTRVFVVGHTDNQGALDHAKNRRVEMVLR